MYYVGYNFFVLKTGFPILAAKVGKTKVLCKKGVAFRPFFYKTPGLCKLYTPLYMLYYALITITLVVLLLFISVKRWQKRQQKLLTLLRSQWGPPKTDYFSFALIEKYTQALHQQANPAISAQTTADLDLNDMFSFIDRTTSMPGQQYLYHLITHPDHSAEALMERDQQADFFTSEVAIREEIQQLLSTLNNEDAYFIAGLLNQNLVYRPWYIQWIPASVMVVITMLLLSPLYPALLVWLFIPVALHLFLHLKNKSNLFQFTRSFPQLNQLIKVAGKLNNYAIPFNKQQAQQSVSSLRSFQQKFTILNLGQLPPGAIRDEMSQLTGYLFELLRAVFLIELRTFFSLIKELENKQADILALYQLVGQVDTALFIASLRAGEQAVCKPHFLAPSKTIRATGIYHPLIPNCTPNSIHIQQKSILLTGSNMSGKSTFLRTLALNALLAQTLYTCFAAEMEIPFTQLHSSIRIDDSLQEGKSYYFEEVNIMAGLVKEAKAEKQNLFILDEVFKGTNTIERIAAGKAILSYLNQHNNIVLVATHDIELTDMLAEEYDLYHFSETIQNNQLHFDHLIKTGPLTTRNAIKILELTGYPASIISEANKISHNMVQQKTNG